VLFGEVVAQKNYRSAVDLLKGADLVLVVGTACDVAPTSDLLNLVSGQAKVFELSLEPSLNRNVDYAFYGSGTECGDFLRDLTKLLTVQDVGL
jgi:NAD-dependent SIR2 family protein deacetylase